MVSIWLCRLPTHCFICLRIFVINPGSSRGFPVAQTVKNLPARWETWVRSLGQEDPLENEMAIHSSMLAWRTPWTDILVGYSPWGCKESDTTEPQTHWQLKSLGKEVEKTKPCSAVISPSFLYSVLQSRSEL